MAEGIATIIHNGSLYAESAGIAATKNGAAPQAVEVMRTQYNVDISEHEARNINDIVVDKFDYVVALDSMVYHYLKALKSIPDEKLFEWNIHDPVGQPIFMFRRVAEKIRKRLEQFLLNREVR